MASEFETDFTAQERAALISEFGQAATHTTTAAVSTSCTVIFRPFFGAVDDIDRSDIYVSQAEIATVQRGDYFVLSGETTRWQVVDVKEKAGFVRLHCRSMLTRL